MHDCFLSSHFQKLVVSSLSVSSLVFTSGSNSKSVRSVESTLFLVAVFVSSIILFNYFIAGYFAVFNHSCLAFARFGELYKELHMWCSRLSFFKLAGYIYCPCLILPCFQVLGKVEVWIVDSWIVECTEVHERVCLLHLVF